MFRFLFIVLFIAVNICLAQESPSGERLRDLAPPDFAIGGVLHGYKESWRYEPYRNTANAEFNAITAAAYMPWGGWPDPNIAPVTRGLTDVTDWSIANHKKVHAHILVYPSANFDLPWYQNLDNHQVEAVLKNYVTTMVQSTAGKIWVWDVVNEVVGNAWDTVDGDGIRKGNPWKGRDYKPFKEYSAMGQSYISKAFRWAKAADPEALLIINDYGIAALNLKSNRLFEFSKKLRHQGVPIDGMGFQMHWKDLDKEPDYDSIRKNLQRFADAGFLIFITEADVATLYTSDPHHNSPAPDQLVRQKRIFKQLLKICLEQPACKSFLMWDFADDQSWLHPIIHDLNDDLPKGTYLFPAPFWGGDQEGQYPIVAKSAYYGLQEALVEHSAGYRLHTGWQPETSFLTRVGIINNANGYDPADTTALYSLDQNSALWSSMKWHLQRVSTGVYRIRCQWGSDNGYLTRKGILNNQGWDPDTDVGLHALHDEWPSQLWKLEPASGGGFRLRNVWSGDDGYLTRVGIPGDNGYEPDNTVSLHEWANWSSQIWYLNRTN